MNKEQFKEYVAKDNPGFYKTRRGHIKKVAPNLLIEIEEHNSSYNIEPLSFADGFKYYISNYKSQYQCKTCSKNVLFEFQYCSNKCKKSDIQNILDKTRNTLKERYGSTSPLGAPGAMEKAQKKIKAKIESINDKRNKTNMERFGVKNPSKLSSVKDKISDSLKNAYIENGNNIIEKRKQTNLINSGEYTTLSSDSVSKIKNTLRVKYNTDNPFAIHSDTYRKAGKGSIDFFSDENNKIQCIKDRLSTIDKIYGSLENMNKSIFQNRKSDIIENLRRDGIHEEILEYSYEKLGFVKCKGKCDHEYDISLQLLRNRHYANHKLCTVCNPTTGQNSSQVEIEIYEWLNEFIECERNVRNQIKGEIDIFVPSKKLGIEYNGIFWHSDIYKDKNYHLNKTLLCEESDIELVHIWEDLWTNKKDIVKGRILSKLNIGQKNIGARKTEIVEINISDAREFVDKNHLQGFRPAYKHYALKYNDEIIYYISISKRNISKSKSNSIEILRACSKLGYNIQGGFSKLFKYIKSQNKGNWITYSDLSWGKGQVYGNGGFKLESYSKPGYWYFIKGERYHRYTYRKSELVKMGHDPNKTEFQIMNEDIKAMRVYDCGNAVWKLNS